MNLKTDKLLPMSPYPYLIEEQLSSLLLSKIHHLHCHLSPTVLFPGNADHTCGPLSNLHKVLQSHPWVSRVHYHLKRRLELLVGHLWRSAVRSSLLGGGGSVTWDAGRGSVGLGGDILSW